MRRFLSVTTLILSLTFALQAAEGGHGEKVAVTALPDAVKATVTKEAPDATDVMKVEKDGVVTYKVKSKDAEGHPQFVTIGADGAVVSKHGAKDKNKDQK